MLRSVDTEKLFGEVICRRVSTQCYVTDECTVRDVAGIFASDSSLHALGVTGLGNLAIGIIVRNDLLSLIGQMYGRELYLGRNIGDFATRVETVYYKRSTFSVVDELSGVLKDPQNVYYMLIDAIGGYRGIISTVDLNLFLSGMMTAELRAAKKIHAAIVKDEISVDMSTASILGTVYAAGEIGGDFQFVKRIDEQRWFISLCDVSGKGLNAGLVSVAVSSMYAAYDFRNGIVELIAKINSYIHGMFDGEIFLTGIFIELDDSTGELQIYDMGHSMAHIIIEGRALSLGLQNGNFPLGISGSIKPVAEERSMNKGELLVVYTDGFHEQKNIAVESFGEERLLSLAVKYSGRSLADIRNILYDELKTWRFGNAQDDDMSLLLVKFM